MDKATQDFYQEVKIKTLQQEVDWLWAENVNYQKRLVKQAEVLRQVQDERDMLRRKLRVTQKRLTDSVRLKGIGRFLFGIRIWLEALREGDRDA